MDNNNCTSVMFATASFCLCSFIIILGIIACILYFTVIIPIRNLINNVNNIITNPIGKGVNLISNIASNAPALEKALGSINQ